MNRWGGGTAASDVSSLLNFSLRGQVSSCGEQRQELVGEALAALLEVDEGDGDRMMVGKGKLLFKMFRSAQCPVFPSNCYNFSCLG